MTLTHDEAEELLREQVEHVLICTSYVPAHFDVKNMSFAEYSAKCYECLNQIKNLND